MAIRNAMGRFDPGFSSIALVAMLSAACNSVPPAPMQMPARDTASEPRAVVSFIADRRAQHVGDLVTVVITEAASVSTSARTRAQKQEGATARLDHVPGDRHSVGGEFERDFSGGGQVERSGHLIARLATTVMEADASGRLRIAGEQRIVANNEEQVVSLEGYVRAEDIGSDNTIASQRVALARIELTGRGVLGRGQAPGWLTRLFMRVGE